MNEYFDYLDIDSSFVPAYPNDNIYKNSAYPSKLQDIMNIQKAGQQQNNNNNNNNNINNMMNMNNNCGLVNSTEGLLRGNMFPNLYDPYKIDSSKMMIPTSEMGKQLFEVQKSSFAMKDINLYLDIHPEDTCMINLYNRYLDEYNKALNNYEAQYGPINLDSKNLNTVPWVWDQTKWPWERGN